MTFKVGEDAFAGEGGGEHQGVAVREQLDVGTVGAAVLGSHGDVEVEDRGAGRGIYPVDLRPGAGILVVAFSYSYKYIKIS